MQFNENPRATKGLELSLVRQHHMRSYAYSATAAQRTPQQGLTLRSKGAPTACHQARAGGMVYIFTSPGLASHRRCPLSSNVRPQIQRFRLFAIKENSMHFMPRYMFRSPRSKRRQFAPCFLERTEQESIRGVIRGVCFRERALYPSPAKSAQRRLRKRLLSSYRRRFGEDDFYTERLVDKLPKLHRQAWLERKYATWRPRLAQQSVAEA